MKRYSFLAVLAVVFSSSLAQAATPELSSFFNLWVGSWHGDGTVTSWVNGIQENQYRFDLKITQTGSASYELFSVVSPMFGNVQQNVTEYELTDAGLIVQRQGDIAQEAAVLESTPNTLSYVLRVFADGRYYDVTYRFALSGSELQGDHQMDYLGQKVSENQFRGERN